jgi:hypothetical protein
LEGEQVAKRAKRSKSSTPSGVTSDRGIDIDSSDSEAESLNSAFVGADEEKSNSRSGGVNNNNPSAHQRGHMSRRVYLDIPRCYSRRSQCVVSSTSNRDKSKKKEVNYLEKIKQTKEKLLEKESLVLPGWTLLYPKHVTNYCPIKLKKTIENPYYAPHIAIKTMEYRLLQRLELNDILGDISPYWNTDLFGEDLSELDDDDDTYLYDDMDDNEYTNNEFD